jgi:sialate O-acetylesterase
LTTFATHRFAPIARSAIAVAICLLLVAPVTARAEVRLPGIFSEGMVLQRSMPVRIWGWADEGERVVVSFRGQEVAAKARDGRWEVTLAPLEAGGPFPLSVAGTNTIAFKDVLVGEVWVSCGQSNMMLGLSKASTGAEAIAASDQFPQIRFANVPGGQADKPADDVAVSWKTAGRATLPGFSAVSYFFGREIHKRLGVPVGLVNVVAIVPGQSWIDEETLLGVPALAELPKRPIKPVVSYNAMIAPIARYAIRGVIYYQGEYNSGSGREYREVMPAIIHSWRRRWGQGDFPFLFVQLPGYHQHLAEKDKQLDMPEAALAALHAPGGASSWAELREAQLLTWQRVPATGMAVAIDLGDPQDIHPANKQPVGERLALLARAVAYGETLVHSGPIVKSLAVDGRSVVVSFDHAETGLAAGDGELRGFELAGADHRYHWADATIRGATVVLTHPEVPEPAFVRYAWANYPNCNLVNAAGLPASPFRAHVEGRGFQNDVEQVSFRNSGFEEAGAEPKVPASWQPKDGAERTNSAAGDGTRDGEWAASLPAKGSVMQKGIADNGTYGYDWNADLFEAARFRPGTLFGYAVEMAAAAGDGPQVGYMRLCCGEGNAGFGHWGGVPEIKTASERFVSRKIAGRMTTKFDLNGNGTSVGAFFANNAQAGRLLLDNLSAISFIRPRLSVSDEKPLTLGRTGPGGTVESQPRWIANGQQLTLPDQRTDDDERQVATLLYGIATVKPSLQWSIAHVWGETDHVGAVILGKDAERFEFVSEHLGGSSRELRLVGGDGEGGLLGGAPPERESLVVRFRGSDEPGDYAASVRIVTQAGNIGRLSSGREGEPLPQLFYVDIPVSVTVAAGPRPAGSVN